MSRKRCESKTMYRYNMMAQMCGSNQLEAEAADYFKLDWAQVQSLSRQPSRIEGDHVRRFHASRSKCHQEESPSKRPSMQRPVGYANMLDERRLIGRCEQPRRDLKLATKTGTNSPNPDQSTSHGHSEGRDAANDTQVLAVTNCLAYSSTASTNSLPSLSSSPSVSPSLLCPHMSLDDILQSRASSQSAHTIGLCAQCRVEPPPNVQSPLSPAFRPWRQRAPPSHKTTTAPSPQRSISKTPIEQQSMRRGYSDHQLSVRRRAKLRAASGRDREESLDWCLGPKDLRRLQLSPTLRHSVDFIRRNSIESARVLRIYKNGQPYDKPLRVCIMRNEFATLDHLLDHINSRQLIPSGARYLFHMDGQLVYSVQELKHGSAYIVSGTRTFDIRANNQLKEELEKASALGSTKSLTRKEALSAPRGSVIGRTTSKVDTDAEKLAKISGETSASSVIAMDASVQSARPKLIKGASDLGSSSSNSGHANIKVKPSAISFEIPGSVHPTSRVASSSQQTPSNNEKAQETSKPERQVLSKKTSSSRTVLVPRTRSTQKRKNQSKSNEDLVGKEPPSTDKKKSQPLTRAKSEMSSLVPKRKKNVTFFDTKRGSSPFPAENDIPASKLDAAVAEGRSSEPSNRTIKSSEEGGGTNSSSIRPAPTVSISRAVKEFETNDIGIQVSDSLDGYLIDLPVRLQSQSEEEQSIIEKARGASRQRGKAIQASKVSGIQAGRTDDQLPSAGQNVGRKTRKIITIRERQLSEEEMGKLKDLSAGDHHRDAHKNQIVTIKLDSVDETQESRRESIEDPDASTPPDRSETIVIGQDPSDAAGAIEPTAPDEDLKPATGSTIDKSHRRLVEGLEANDPPESKWQYPGGRAASATPTERPVSQSDANETVHARVTTPTPSISTVGDSLSLTLSHDMGTLMPSGGYRGMPKQRVPVTGRLCRGVDEPNRNFRLLWVNGVAQIDQFPDTHVSSTEAGAESNTDDAHLSPGGNRKASAPVFRPSERFHNFSYSRRFNELIYPAGCLVVLWCREANEQRYYSRHTASVSAVALVSADSDLVASSQVGEPTEKISASVHLWSLESLESLTLVEDDLFRYKRIFAVKIRSSRHAQETEEVEMRDKSQELTEKSTKNEPEKYDLDILARDDKHLWTFVIKVKVEKGDERKSPGKRSALVSVAKTSKVLQSNQVPLLIGHLPLERRQQEAAVASKKPTPQSHTGEVLLTFGRRHLQVWSIQTGRQPKLEAIQPREKNPSLVEVMRKINCVARVTPKDLLVGDSDGELSLITIGCASVRAANQNTSPSAKGSNTEPRQKYSAKLKRLSAQELPNPGRSAITCVARISANLFVSGDSECVLRFWRIDRTIGDQATGDSSHVVSGCHEICSMQLPRDLGFVCSLIPSSYTREESRLEFYVSLTSSAILFGSVQLQSASPEKPQSSLSVLYEGHDTSAMSLVADTAQANGYRSKTPGETEHAYYFTCSLDCKICKWDGHRLVWRSVLPSACASLACHPVGFVLAVGSADGTVYILDKISGLLISYFPLTPVCINCLSYSRDGSLLAAGCANGSIFILPVYDRGLKYKKVSIFQSPYPVVSLQFSLDSRYILTSVTHARYQELILWDLPNFRYMRDNVTLAANQIDWLDPICSGSEDVRAIWDNANLAAPNDSAGSLGPKSRLVAKGGSGSASRTVINLSCHRLETKIDRLVIASDMRGFMRLFQYPAFDAAQGFYEIRISSSAVNCCRFLAFPEESKETEVRRTPNFVSTSLDGLICLWTLE